MFSLNLLCNLPIDILDELGKTPSIWLFRWYDSMSIVYCVSKILMLYGISSLVKSAMAKLEIHQSIEVEGDEEREATMAMDLEDLGEDYSSKLKVMYSGLESNHISVDSDGSALPNMRDYASSFNGLNMLRNGSEYDVQYMKKYTGSDNTTTTVITNP